MRFYLHNLKVVSWNYIVFFSVPREGLTIFVVLKKTTAHTRNKHTCDLIYHQTVKETHNIKEEN